MDDDRDPLLFFNLGGRNDMAKFFEICGTSLEEATRLCPNCDADTNNPKRLHQLRPRKRV